MCFLEKKCVYYSLSIIIPSHYHQYLEDGLPHILLVCITRLRIFDIQKWQWISVVTN